MNVFWVILQNGMENVPVNVFVNDRQKQILSIIQKDRGITIVSLAMEMNVNEKTIKRDLRILKELNIIKRVGSDKTGHWKLIH